MLFISCNVVKAGEATLIKDVMDNTFTYYYDSNQSRYRYLYTSKYIFGENVAYCIELGKPIDSFNYTYTNSFDGVSFSEEDLDYIKLVAYYGYDYPNHNNTRYYIAAQDIIWQRLSGISVKYLVNINENNVIDISKEKNDIYELMSKHNVKPSFADKRINVTIGKEYVLEDTNGVLSSYTCNDDNVHISGNTLVIEDDFEGDSITLNRVNYTDKQFFLYSSGSNQKMMSSGGVSSPSVNVNINLIGGSISLEKLDRESGNTPMGEGTLDGAVYDLYDANMKYIDSFVTGKKNKIDNLSLGKYFIKEKSSSRGYRLDMNTYEIVISENDLNKNITVYEDVIKRQVDIFKVFASGGTGILTTESGVVFDVYNNSDVKVGSITTDSDGYGNIILPYGKYTFKQVTSTKNYYMVDDFVVNIDKYDTKPIYRLLSDSEITARVKIIKKDIDTMDNIVNSGIKFKIFDVKENKYVSFKVTYPEAGEIDTFTIDSNGEFITPSHLHSGEYILYEVDESMDGYLYNKDGVKFYIGEESNFINDDDYGMMIEVPFYNKIVKGKVIINKYGEEIRYVDNSFYYKNIMLEGTEFELIAGEDIYENGKLIYGKDDVVDTILTDGKGRGTIDNLPLGEYYLKEIKSSMGNVFDDTLYDVSLKYKDQYTDKINFEIDIDNYIEKGKVIIHKLDLNSNEVIPNTLIEIRNISNAIVYKGYTDSNGMIIVEGLPYGEYYLAEVEASTGYRLLEDDIYFTLDSDEYEMCIYNERMEVPNTGASIGLRNILIIVMILIFVFVFILFFDNKRVVFLSSLFIILGISYFGVYFYNYFMDNKMNEVAIERVVSNKLVMVSNDDRYGYTSFIEIPSIGLKRGLVDEDNSYNNVNSNIKIIDKSSDRLILASHNGNNYNSYFGKLYKMELGDKIYLYENGNRYEYLYSDSYIIKKNGTAEIYTNDNGNKCIVLITCLEGSDDAQVVYIGYLNDINSYLKEQ